MSLTLVIYHYLRISLWLFVKIRNFSNRLLRGMGEQICERKKNQLKSCVSLLWTWADLTKPITTEPRITEHIFVFVNFDVHVFMNWIRFYSSICPVQCSFVFMYFYITVDTIVCLFSSSAKEKLFVIILACSVESWSSWQSQVSPR